MLLVVLNHLQFRHADGGYVGVDVFFVISGYLIGASMIAEFRRDAFSLAAFYERRVRRIFPALLAMLFFVTALAWYYLMPSSLIDYSKSAFAALGSYSNFYFWGQGGYFDAPSATKPLLHTWSLAVEEQFYLLLPLVLYFIFRSMPSKLRGTLWALTGLTLALAIWFVHVSPSTAFFWSPLRAWELLIGVLISQYPIRSLRSRLGRELAAAAGLIAILSAGVLFSSTTPFPGFAAVLPCAGAVLIIAAGQVGNSVTASFLALPPLRFVGLISYSLYLWHWPIYVFQNTTLILSPYPSWHRNTKLCILSSSLLIAALSWWLVETPFRKGRWKPNRRTLFWINGLCATMLVCICGMAVRAKGAPSRLRPEIARVGAFLSLDTDAAWRAHQCFLLPSDSPSAFRQDVCLKSVSGKKNYLLLGDSTAAHLYPGLIRTFPELNIQQATAASCLPYDETPLRDLPGYQSNCDAMWHFLHDSWYPSHRPDAVIIAAMWDGSSLTKLTPEIELYHRLNIPVMLLGPVLGFDIPLPTLIIANLRHQKGGRSSADYISTHMISENVSLDTKMRQKADFSWHISFVSYFEELCEGRFGATGEAVWHTSNGCPIFADNGDPLLFDMHHFTPATSAQFAEALRRDGKLPLR